MLGLNRASHYYKPKGESEENLKIMEQMDKHHMDYPSYGVIRMTDLMRECGYKISERRIRRLMHKAGLHTIYPHRSLSKVGVVSYVKPYLLRGIHVTHRNQVWSIDISYIPMRKGFMYLIAIIDVYSRFVVGWGLSNTLDTTNCINVLTEAVNRYGVPEIINSDQGCQFTSKEWADKCGEYEGMKVSMDGKGRAKDNIWIERFWRSIKYDYIYLNPSENGRELYSGIKKYIENYNFNRHHQGIDRKKPCELYLNDVA